MPFQTSPTDSPQPATREQRVLPDHDTLFPTPAPPREVVVAPQVPTSQQRMPDRVISSRAFVAAHDVLPERPVPVQPTQTPSPRSQQRLMTAHQETVARSLTSGLYLLLEAGLVIGLYLIAIQLWFWDATYTMAFLEGNITSFATWAWWKRWFVPLFFTVGFLGIYPHARVRRQVRQAKNAWLTYQTEDSHESYRRQRRYMVQRMAGACFIQGLNIITSFRGMLIELPGHHFNVLVPVTLPETGTAIWGICIALAGFLAFGPELLMRWITPIAKDVLTRFWHARFIFMRTPRKLNPRKGEHV